MKTLYTARVQVTGGRDGGVTSSDGKLSVRLALPSELGGSGDATNPEQLFVAGYAACFASSLKAAAHSKNIPIGRIDIDGEGVLSVRDDGSYFVSRVVLAVDGEGLGPSAAAVVEEAKRICAYSNATRGNVNTEIDLVRSTHLQGA